jgi:hypothetical protein
MKQKGKIWTDREGKEIPSHVVNPVAKKEEYHTQKIADTARKAAKLLQQLVEQTYEAYNDVYDAKLAYAKITGNKANFAGMTINSFDGKVEVKITKPDSLYFDNTFTDLVKQKFTEYFNLLNVGDDETNIFLRDLVNDLLYTSGGKLDQSKVFKLRKYRETIQNSKKLSEAGKTFIDAVDLFDKAIKTKAGNTGIYVSEFDEKTLKMERIPIKYTDV